MELSEIWTCSCGAENTGDVFYGTCWKCGVSWAKEPLKVETAEELNMCPDCKSELPFHTMRCPSAKWPDWCKPK